MKKRKINTQGGSYIKGRVETNNGDFIGRDKIINNYYNKFTPKDDIKTDLKERIAVFLPPVVPNFIEREDVIGQITAALDPSNGITKVGLYGMPGSGKRVVALQVANMMKEKFSGGILWGSFDEKISSPEEMVQSWARRLLLYENDDTVEESMILVNWALSECKKNGPVLVILDGIRDSWIKGIKNCILQTVKDHSCLITSYHKELVDNLVENKSNAILVRIMTMEEAKKLLRVYTGPLDLADGRRVERLLNQVGRLPLAISIIGKQLGKGLKLGLSANDVLAHLTRSLTNVPKGSEKLPIVEEFDKKIYSAFRVAFDSVSPEARFLFTKLSIFPPGQIHLPEIFAILGYTQDKNDYVHQILTILNDVLLVEYYPRERRLHLHPLLSQFARYEIDQVLYKELHMKASEYYLQLTTLDKSDDVSNLKKAHSHAKESGNIAQAAAILLEHDLPSTLVLMGQKDTIISMSKQTFGLKGTGPLTEYLKRQGYTHLDDPTIPAEQKARFYRQLGICLSETEHYPQAIQSFIEAERLLSPSVDPREASRLYREMAVALSFNREHSRALQYCEKAWEMLDDTLVDIDVDRANIYMSFGNAEKGIGHYDAAVDHYQKAQELFLKNDKWSRAYEACDNIGTAYQEKGEYSSALEYHRQALEGFEQVNNLLYSKQASLNVAVDSHYIGQASNDIGLLKEAFEQYLEVLPVLEDFQEVKSWCRCLGNMGELNLTLYALIGSNKYLVDAQEFLIKAIAEMEDEGDKEYYESILVCVEKELAK